VLDGEVVFVEDENVLYYYCVGIWFKINESAVLTAWAWGRAIYGAIGDNTSVDKSSPVSVVGGFADWAQVSAGQSSGNHTLGLRANGTLWSWGLNTNGQLGDGTVTNKSSPVLVVGGFSDWTQVSSGLDHSLGIRANGIAWAWGKGSLGRLGTGDTTNRSSPVSVAGGFTDWNQISAGAYHSVGLRKNGTAWAWGSNLYGQLGNYTYSTQSRSSPVSVLGGFTDWIQLTAGGNHNLGLRANGTAWAWGGNGYGPVGDGTVNNKSSPVSVVGAITNWIQLSAGAAHSIGLRSNGTAWTWGQNTAGQLGTGNTTNRSSPVSVVGGFTNWVQLSAGTGSFGIRGNGTAWAWGSNYGGGLGDGSIYTASKSSPVSVVGGFTDWIQLDAGTYRATAIRSL
jgi:alpha-tubulin suppressor-like RCC1 family protein